jgi:hypothetical protein
MTERAMALVAQMGPAVFCNVKMQIERRRSIFSREHRCPAEWAIKFTLCQTIALEVGYPGMLTTAFEQEAEMQSRSIETFGDATGAANTTPIHGEQKRGTGFKECYTPKRRAKRVRKRVDSAGERIARRGCVMRE